MRRFEFVAGSSRKFWEIELAGVTLTVRWGRLGTAGRSQTRTFASADEARQAQDRQIAEKTEKGYREVDGSAGGAAPDAARRSVRPGPAPVESKAVGSPSAKVRPKPATRGKARLPAVAAPVTMLMGFRNPPRVMTFSPDSRRFAAIPSASPVVYLWDVGSGTLLHRLTHPADALAACWDASDRLVVTAGGGELHVWDAGRGKRVATGRVKSKRNADQVVCAPDGRLVTIEPGLVIRWWSPGARPTGETTLSGSEGGLSRDGRLAATWDEPGILRLFDLSSGGGCLREDRVGGAFCRTVLPVRGGEGVWLSLGRNASSFEDRLGLWRVEGRAWVWRETSRAYHTLADDRHVVRCTGDPERERGPATGSGTPSLGTMLDTSGDPLAAFRFTVGTPRVALSPDRRHLAAAAMEGIELWATGLA